jgi:hypothetical protein
MLAEEALLAQIKSRFMASQVSHNIAKIIGRGDMLALIALAQMEQPRPSSIHGIVPHSQVRLESILGSKIARMVPSLIYPIGNF